jgi:hypothetical protein
MPRVQTEFCCQILAAFEAGGRNKRTRLHGMVGTGMKWRSSDLHFVNSGSRVVPKIGRYAATTATRVDNPSCLKSRLTFAGSACLKRLVVTKVSVMVRATSLRASNYTSLGGAI